MSANLSSRPRRFARAFRAVVIASGTIAVLVGAIWILSTFRSFALTRDSGSLVRISAIADSQDGAWEYTSTIWTLLTYPHQFRIMRGAYLDVMHSKAEADLRVQSEGWGIRGHPGPASAPAWFKAEANNWRFFGLGTTKITSARAVDIPYWLLIAFFATPPLLAVARSRRRHNRIRKNRCPECGYQLDTTVTKCPECGEGRQVAEALTIDRRGVELGEARRD